MSLYYLNGLLLKTDEKVSAKGSNFKGTIPKPCFSESFHVFILGPHQSSRKPFFPSEALRDDWQ